MVKKRIKFLNSSFKFIDIGCGAGHLSFLNKLNFLCDGVDIDTNKLNKAKKRAKLFGLKREGIFIDNINYIKKILMIV